MQEQVLSLSLSLANINNFNCNEVVIPIDNKGCVKLWINVSGSIKCVLLQKHLTSQISRNIKPSHRVQ